MEIGVMSQAVIGRWGKNLAVRFPADVAKAAGLDDGQRVEIVPGEGEVVIRKLPPELTIETMFHGRPPEAWRELYDDAYDWGPDRGRERVDE
jgi:antitoxin MazE